MRHRIFKDGQQVNTIVGDAAFVEELCRANGYTSEPIHDEPEPKPAPAPTLEQRVEELERIVAQLLKKEETPQ